MKSNQKSSHPGCFFAAQGLCPANQSKPRAASFCAISLKPISLAKDAMPFAVAPTHHVLPFFTQSRPADTSSKGKNIVTKE
jgi:hypothetical protein